LLQSYLRSGGFFTMPYFDLNFHVRLLCQRRLGVGLFIFILGFQFAPARADSSSPRAGEIGLTLKELLQRVLDYNESLQVRMLQVEIARKSIKAERGIFEPELVGSVGHEDNKRPNTVEQQSNLQGATEFDERNNIYSGGLESLVPTGARLRLGYSLRDLVNNLQTQPNFLSRGATNGEYVTFVGLSMVQPLLKNAGTSATMANLRLAAANSELAFQEYRKQLMQLVATAEAAYWELYFAQEQSKFFDDSVQVAEGLLKDSREGLNVGKTSELDVLEAEAGLASRRSKQSDTRQKVVEAFNRLISLYSGTVTATNAVFVATDRPEINSPNLSYFEGWQSAFDLNPDYLTRRKQIVVEEVRVAYARNQRWPQLDLKASYGLNGLGNSPSASWDDVQRQSFPSWSVGLEMRVPLAGGAKVRNELSMAKLRQKQALLNLKEIETQIANGLDSALRKIQNTSQSVTNYQTVAGFNQNLLATQLKRLEVGKIDSQKVLETEEKLFEAKNAVVGSLVDNQRALLEWELINGSILKNRKLDLTKDQLESKTALILKNGNLTDAQYDDFLKEVKRAFLKDTTNPGAREKGL
jgi:outer membrane protein TolC